MSNNPLVCAITINFNKSSWTIDCLKSIQSSTYKNISIILVDNGSDAYDYEILKNYVESVKTHDIHLLRIEKNIGYVNGINRALEQCSAVKCNNVFILNNDTILDKDALGYLVQKQISCKNKAIVSGKVYDYDNKKYLQYIGQYEDKSGGINHLPVVKNKHEFDRGQYDYDMEMGMLDDIFWLFPLNLYKKIGGYSRYFFLYGEQNDFALRAVKEGYKLVYVHSAKIWHKGGVTTCNGDKKSPKISYWLKVNVLKLGYLHLEKSKFTKFYFSWVARETLKLLLNFLFFRSNVTMVRVHFHALHTFRGWKREKYFDNGYNPFG